MKTKPALNPNCVLSLRPKPACAFTQTTKSSVETLQIWHTKESLQELLDANWGKDVSEWVENIVPELRLYAYTVLHDRRNWSPELDTTTHTSACTVSMKVDVWSLCLWPFFRNEHFQWKWVDLVLSAIRNDVDMDGIAAYWRVSLFWPVKWPPLFGGGHL